MIREEKKNERIHLCLMINEQYIYFEAWCVMEISIIINRYDVRDKQFVSFGFNGFNENLLYTNSFLVETERHIQTKSVISNTHANISRV